MSYYIFLLIIMNIFFIFKIFCFLVKIIGVLVVPLQYQKGLVMEELNFTLRQIVQNSFPKQLLPFIQFLSTSVFFFKQRTAFSFCRTNYQYVIHVRSSSLKLFRFQSIIWTFLFRQKVNSQLVYLLGAKRPRNLFSFSYHMYHINI